MLHKGTDENTLNEDAKSDDWFDEISNFTIYRHGNNFATSMHMLSQKDEIVLEDTLHPANSFVTGDCVELAEKTNWFEMLIS